MRFNDIFIVKFSYVFVRYFTRIVFYMFILRQV
jgi:hypothetical protein